MADVILNSMIIRLRHPVHEAGKMNDFCCTTQEWMVDAEGAAVPLQEKGPFTPEQLIAKGFALPTIMGQLTQSALLDRDAANTARAAAIEARNTAQADRTASQADRQNALTERNGAITARDAALAALAECQASQAAQASAAAQVIDSLRAEIATLTAAAQAAAMPNDNPDPDAAAMADA